MYWYAYCTSTILWSDCYWHDAHEHSFFLFFFFFCSFNDETRDRVEKATYSANALHHRNIVNSFGGLIFWKWQISRRLSKSTQSAPQKLSARARYMCVYINDSIWIHWGGHARTRHIFPCKRIRYEREIESEKWKE